jgi:hypothetical protein
MPNRKRLIWVLILIFFFFANLIALAWWFLR